MGIFDFFLSKNKADEGPNREELPPHYLQISDCLIDWFKEDGLSLDGFDKRIRHSIWEDYYQRCLEDDFSPDYYSFFTPMALYYLLGTSTSATQTAHRLKHLAVLLANDNPKWLEYGLSYLFYELDKYGVSPDHADFKALKRGEEIVKVYFIVVQKVWGSAESIIATDLVYYVAFLREFAIDQLATLSAQYVNQTLEDGALDDQLVAYIKEEVVRANRQSAELLDVDVVVKTLNLLRFARTPEADVLKKKRSIRISEYPILNTFATDAKGKELHYLSAIFYLFNIKGLIPDKFDTILVQVTLAIIGDVQLDVDWIYRHFEVVKPKLIQCLGQLISNRKDSLQYDDRLVKLYEQYCFGQFNEITQWTLYPKEAKLLIPFYQQIADERLRGIYTAHVEGVKIVGKLNLENGESEYRLDGDRKLAVTEQLISLLTAVLPVAFKKTKAHYNKEGRWVVAYLQYGSDEVEITTDSVVDINRFLSTEETGYQLVPLYLAEEQVENIRYTLGSLAIYNYEQYLFAEQQLDVTTGFSSIYSSISYTKRDAVAFERLQDAPQKNGFSNSRDWEFFRANYLSNLSTKEKWYELMDVVVHCTGTKSPNEKWVSQLKPLIETFPASRYYQELQHILTESLKDDFWFDGVYLKALKGLIWSCTFEHSERSLNVIRLIVEEAYRKRPEIGARSSSLGNFGLAALIDTQSEVAFGMLVMMRNGTRYQRFAAALDRAIDQFKVSSHLSEELLADKTIPSFGVCNGERTFQVGEFTLRLYYDGTKWKKEWSDTTKREYKSVPEVVKKEYPYQLKEANNIVKQITKLYADLGKRVRSYWLHNRTWQAKDWFSSILNHPLVGLYIQNVVWRNCSTNDDFIVVGAELQRINGDNYQLNADDVVELWHPVLATTEQIEAWQRYMWNHQIVQPERQAFREYYPFSKREQELTNSPRFANHFLEVNKLMALANAQGWQFTYAHEGDNWPRIYVKPLDITFHLQCDYSRVEDVIPTQGIFVTRGDSTQLDDINRFEKIPFRELPVVALSELCRDVDLFIAVSSIVYSPELASLPIYNGYYQKYEEGLFSENSSAVVRKQILTTLLPLLKIKSSGFEGNYLLVDGSLNSYKINLGSGFVQTKSGKHLNLLPSASASAKLKVQLPIADDDTLYIIIAEAMLLTNDSEITDDELLKLIG